jgi:hypothetical protein
MLKKIFKIIKSLLRIPENITVSDSEIEEIINSNYSAPMHQSVGNDAPIAERSIQTATPGDSAQSIVSFLITKQGNIDLNISWDDTDEVTAKNLATILYLINNGGFENSCAELLMKMAQEDPEQMPFVRSIIVEWNNRKTGDDLVKPSEVFQFGTLGTHK